MPKRLPYGISNFARIIEQNYAYVDKTRYIELLENENNPSQFLLRPRRFGKSLFLSMLEHYYDINKKSEFESLFSGLYISQNPTPERGTYAVMRFDFSGIDTENHEIFRKSFLYTVQAHVIDFLKQHKDIFPNAERDVDSIMGKDPGIDVLLAAYSAAGDAGVPIFAIIDEYDHFANKLIAMGKTYKEEVRAGGLVRAFYESLKKATSSVVGRIFVTGVSPMMANDMTSGFNMAENLSLLPEYNETFGFTRKEVEWLMAETGVDGGVIEVDMEACYNGYMFSKKGKDTLYNSQMTLHLFNQVLRSGEQPDEIVDDNLKTDYGRLRRLAENEGNRAKLLEIITNGKVSADVISKFSVDDLQKEEYFVSFLFYLGMLTIGGTDRDVTRLVIPNYSIKTLYWEYMAEYLKNTEGCVIDTQKLIEVIGNMAYDGDIMPCLNYFTENVLKRLSNRDLQRFDEKYIKVMMLTNLFIVPLYLPVSEDENINGYTDVYLLKHPAKHHVKYEYVFEIKYAKTDATEAEIAAKFAEAEAQIERYKKDPRYAGKDNIKFAVLVFKGKGDVEVNLQFGF